MPVDLVSPGIIVKEIDRTLGQIQTSSTLTAGIVAPFERGPVDILVPIASENELLEVFGQPSATDRQYESWLTISSYLAYGGVMQVVRSDNDLLSNAYSGASLTGIKINSLEEYTELGYDDNTIPGVTVAARNPGSWANGIKVAMLDGRADQILEVANLATALPLLQTSFGIVQTISKVAPGAGVTVLVEGDLKGIVTGIDLSADQVDVKVLSFTPSTGPNAGVEVEVDYQEGGTWSFVAGSFDVYEDVGTTPIETGTTTAPADWFDSQVVSFQNGRVTVAWNTLANRPTTTEFARTRNSRFDELHIVVFVATGEVTGNAGTILEKAIGMSKGRDAEFAVGTPSYWRRYLAGVSEYLFGGSEPDSTVPTGFILDQGNGFDPFIGGQWDQQVRNTIFDSCGNLELILQCLKLFSHII